GTRRFGVPRRPVPHGAGLRGRRAEVRRLGGRAGDVAGWAAEPAASRTLPVDERGRHHSSHMTLASTISAYEDRLVWPETYVIRRGQRGTVPLAMEYPADPQQASEPP